MVEIEWRRLNRPKTDAGVDISNCESDRPLDCRRASDGTRCDNSAASCAAVVDPGLPEPGLCPRKA